MTKSSVNFKAVKSAGHAVSHASREVAPTYLLAPDKSMGTIVLLDDEGRVTSMLEAKLALASRQALREKNYSPVWEGILNLRRPEAGEDAKAYRAECSAVVTDWYKRYEATTGHKVLRVDVHLDEGHMVDGEAVFNAHAHVIADRTNDIGRVMQLSPKMLRELQTLTAEVTGLERGKSSFETGRKHISHHAYKHLAERGRLETQQVKTELDKSQSDLTRQRKLSKEWSDSDLAKVKDLKAQLDGEPARLEAALKAQEVQLKAQYQLDREALKATGEARQKDYQALKAAHEKALAEAKKVPDLVAAVTLKTVEIDRLTPRAAQVPGLEAQAVQQAAAISTLKGEAVGFREHITKTKNDLDKAQAEAAKVPDLVADLALSKGQITAQAEAFDKLKADAMAIITPLRTEVKNMKAQIDQLEADKAEMKALAEKWAGKAVHYQEQKAAGVSAHLIVPGTTPAVLTPAPMPTEATKRALGPQKQPEVPIPLPKAEKSLTERLAASWKAMVGWITGNSGKCIEIDTQHSEHHGPVVQLDDLHAVQRTGRGLFAIHQLDHLDNVPARDDPKIIIRYKEGKGTVHGQLGQEKGGRGD